MSWGLTSNDVKSCRNANHVELMDSAIFQFDTFLSKSHNRVILDINQLNIWTIELLVVCVLKARTLDAKGVWRLQRRQQVSRLRVAYTVSNISCPEIVSFSVGLGVIEVVFVIPKPEAETTVIYRAMGL